MRLAAEVFSWLMVDTGGQTIVDSVAPGQEVLGCIRKQDEQAMDREQARKQHPSMASALVPTSRLLS